MRLMFFGVVLGVFGFVYGLEIDDAYALPSPLHAKNAAVYMNIRNDTNNDIVITSVSSNASKLSQIHTSIHHGDMSHMQELPSLAIKAQDSVALVSGGLHIMLLELVKPLMEGEDIELEFHLENGEVVSFKNIPVRFPAQ